MLTLTTCKYCKGSGHSIDHKAVGSALARKREELSITRVQMAKALQVSPSLIFRLERGERSWTKDVISRYEDVLARAKKPAEALRAALK